MNKVKTSELQKRAVNGILEGKAPGQAMIDAGYTAITASHPRQNLIVRAGVQAYLAKFDKASRRKFGMNLGDKLVDIFLDGLSANKLAGKNDEEVPDWGNRAVFAKQLAEFMNWIKPKEESRSFQQQNNLFFSIDDQTRGEFNERFKLFLKKFYQSQP